MEEKHTVYIPVSMLYPHPDNPRKDLGDLSELAASIKENGVFQNLTVVEDRKRHPDGGYTVIIGHRRTEAAKLAGVVNLPCYIVEMSEAEQIQTMLLENMQRSDLTFVEEADSFQMLIDMGSTEQEISKKTGFSRTTVRHRLEIAKLDKDKLKAAQTSGRQVTIMDLQSLEKIEDMDVRNSLLTSIGTGSFSYNVSIEYKKQEGKKVIPLIMAELQERGVKVVEARKTYGDEYGYLKMVSATDYKPGKFADLDGHLVRASVDEFGLVRVYTYKKKEGVKKKTPEELALEEKRISKWETAKRLEREARQHRIDFLEHVMSLSPKNDWEIAQGAAIAASYKALEYSRGNRTAVCKELETEKSPYDNAIQAAALTKIAHWSFHARNKAARIIYYSTFCEDDDTYAFIHGYEKGGWPEKCDKPIEMMRYTVLTLWGYQPTEEEMKLVNGTHECFSKE